MSGSSLHRESLIAIVFNTAYIGTNVPTYSMSVVAFFIMKALTCY